MSKKILNANTIDSIYDLTKYDDCKHFLLNLMIDGKRVTEITLANGEAVRMKDIPKDQVIQRANELASWIKGKH